MSLEDLRKGLAFAGRVRFLNYAATAPALSSSAERMAEVAREGGEPLALHFNQWLTRVESARRAAAGAIGSWVDEITFTTNTSTALSLAAASVRWRPGDRVLYPADEFPSNRFVWENLRDLGVRAEAIEPEEGVGFAEQLGTRDLDGVRMVALSAVSYRDGRRLDVEAVGRLCRERGIWMTVDAIQAVGAIPVDVRAWGCDFLACGGQKWLLGPVGTGFLFVARERLEELHVPTVGWASSRHAGDPEVRRLEWCEGAARFEGGLPDVVGIAGLGASLESLAQAGWDAVFERVRAHRSRVAEGLAERGLVVRHAGLPGAHAGIATFEVREDRMEPLAEELAKRRVMLTSRPRELRVSAHGVTSEEEVDVFFEALDAALGRHAAPPRAARRPSGASSVRPSVQAGRWRKALVTGASRGLGAALAQELAARGAETILVGRDHAALEEGAAAIRARGGVAEIVELDLADRVAVTKWIAGASLSALDLLVNNAARADAAPFVDEPEDRPREAFETNLFAPMALARATLPGMIARGRGAILNVVAAGGRNALPLFSTYAASKAALWAWSESLGRELDGTGVTVTTLVPPHMDTATRRQLGRRAVGYYRLPVASDSEGHRPASGHRLTGVARRALDAAWAGRTLVLPGRARWEIWLNSTAPWLANAMVRRLWTGAKGASPRAAREPL